MDRGATLLLEQQADLEDAEAQAAVLLGDGDAEQTGGGQFLPRCPLATENLFGQLLQLELLVVKREIHQIVCVIVA